MPPTPRLALALLLTTAASCAAAPQVGRRATANVFPLEGDLDLSVGARFQRDDAWGDLQEQPAGSLTITQEDRTSWFGFEAGVSYASEDESVNAVGTSSIEARTREFSLGLTSSARFGRSRWRGYVGAGASYLDLEFEGVQGGTVFRSDSGVFGGYARAGLRYALGTGHIGLEYRAFAGGTESAGPIVFDSDYHQLALVLGTSL